MSMITPIRTTTPEHPLASIETQNTVAGKTKNALQSVNDDMVQSFLAKESPELLKQQPFNKRSMGQQDAIVELFKSVIPNIQGADKDALNRIVSSLAGTLDVPFTMLRDSVLEQAEYLQATISQAVLQPLETVQALHQYLEQDGTLSVLSAVGKTASAQTMQTLNDLMSRIKGAGSDLMLNLSAQTKALSALSGVAMVSGVPEFIDIVRKNLDESAHEEFNIQCVWNAALAGDAKTLNQLLNPQIITSALTRFPLLFECWCSNYADQFLENETAGLLEFNALKQLAWNKPAENLDWMFYANQKLRDFLFRNLDDPSIIVAIGQWPEQADFSAHNPDAAYMF